MEPPERPAEMVARDVIAHLRQSVQALIDGDRILPADGLPLLASLDQALAGPDGVSAPSGTRHVGGSLCSSAQAGIEAFIGWAQALIEAGVLAAEDGRPRIEAAVAMGALLRSAGGTDLKTSERQGPPTEDSVAIDVEADGTASVSSSSPKDPSLANNSITTTTSVVAKH
jgi:hypothetical protein